MFSWSQQSLCNLQFTPFRFRRVVRTCVCEDKVSTIYNYLLGDLCRLRSSLDCSRRLGFEADPALSQFLPCKGINHMAPLQILSEAIRGGFTPRGTFWVSVHVVANLLCPATSVRNPSMINCWQSNFHQFSGHSFPLPKRGCCRYLFGKR